MNNSHKGFKATIKLNVRKEVKSTILYTYLSNCHDISLLSKLPNFSEVILTRDRPYLFRISNLFPSLSLCCCCCCSQLVIQITLVSRCGTCSFAVQLDKTLKQGTLLVLNQGSWKVIGNRDLPLYHTPFFMRIIL